MNKYRVTDINNASCLIEAKIMGIETINDLEVYIAFYVDAEVVALLNLSNIISVVKEN